MDIPKYSIRKLKMNFEFFDNRKVEVQGRYNKDINSMDLTFIDLDNKGQVLHLEDEYCEELAKIFYALFRSFKDMQGDEVTVDREFDLMEYHKKINGKE